MYLYLIYTRWHDDDLFHIDHEGRKCGVDIPQFFLFICLFFLFFFGGGGALIVLYLE